MNESTVPTPPTDPQGDQHLAPVARVRAVNLPVIVAEDEMRLRLQARRLCPMTTLAYTGPADGVVQNPDGTYTVHLDYCLCGVPVGECDCHALLPEYRARLDSWFSLGDPRVSAGVGWYGRETTAVTP